MHSRGDLELGVWHAFMAVILNVFWQNCHPLVETGQWHWSDNLQRQSKEMSLLCCLLVESFPDSSLLSFSGVHYFLEWDTGCLQHVCNSFAHCPHLFVSLLIIWYLYSISTMLGRICSKRWSCFFSRSIYWRVDCSMRFSLMVVVERSWRMGSSVTDADMSEHTVFNIFFVCY